MKPVAKLLLGHARCHFNKLSNLRNQLLAICYFHSNRRLKQLIFSEVHEHTNGYSYSSNQIELTYQKLI